MDDILEIDFVQASRVLKLSSPLGDDKLLPERMVIEEGVNRLFEITLHVRAKREEVKPEELIGHLVDVSLEIRQGEFDEEGVRRPFNGLVTDLEEGPPVTRGLRSYTLTIRPQMWLLSRRSDCRIWQDMTSIQVLQTLFSEHGLPNPDIGFLQNKPPAQHYSVQWNETDLDYLLRRLEEDGIFFWFLHEKGVHRLRVTDHQIAWSDPSASAEGEMNIRLAQGSSDRNHITDWVRRFRYIPGQRVDADWNFETPSFIPERKTQSNVLMPGAVKRELYEYPARVADDKEAERAGKLRAQASEAEHERVTGKSTVRVLEPGRKFKPYEEPNPDRVFEEHVITYIRHEAVDRSYETTENEPEYTNRFEAIPARIPFTPHRTTKRPRIEGAQVGIVAGPEGEEIHPDKYGRIKVWFPWDRRAKKDGTDTCWIRVSQSWAGGLWGSQVIPRIGMEVMVAYIDGDPDRPLVTGVVPNPLNPVPYDLPANKTKSVFRTNTHKGKSAQKFNELTFEDEAGREEIFLHAQKDRNEIINNDETKLVRKDTVHRHEGFKSVSIGKDYTSYVGNVKSTNVYGNYNISVGQAFSGSYIFEQLISPFFKVSDNLKRIHLSKSLSLGEGMMNVMVQNDKIETIGRSDLKVIGSFSHQIVGGIRREEVGEDYVLSIGNNFHEAVAEIRSIKSGERIDIICGKSRIILEQNGSVTIEGVTVKIIGDRVDIN
ncbi:type VI secretion system Vgr family protein [Allorhizobium terrae]|uniref:Type VI secretion system tip protein VgrG n=1 Tax=Allorhizobium terrae TaxID=1848972 RepID=A0A4S3ZPX6_9HYPH|nr:type VI secretion system tip protein TssI/VgrG [Allorhizobium terrae]THF47588.1 type VI secretion system tip protein VgrG [Allorhizobium terrae]